MKTIGTSKQGLREYQQDAFARAVIDDITILVVADGNGGTGGQELAESAVKSSLSWLALELASGNYRNITSEDELRGLGLGAVREAATQVSEAKKLNQSWGNAGTTITLVLINKHVLGVWWVGDSPCYLFNSGTIKLMTDPVHTLAEELIKEGHSRESIKNQPTLNCTLIRCLGIDNCEPDEIVVKLDSSVLIVAGSDGVLDYISTEELVEIIKSQFSTCFDIQQLSDSIVQKALDNGSDDNVTVVLALAVPDLKLSKTTSRLTRLIKRRG